jgi:hypothetical protein
MYRPTISIRMLLAVVAFIALACTSIAWANGIWATTLFTASLGVLLFAVLALILRRGVKQAFWIGFALFGWGYIWMAHWPNSELPRTGIGGSAAHGDWILQRDDLGSLATTRVLTYAYTNWLPAVRTEPTQTYSMEGYDGVTRTVISPAPASSFPHINHFTRVGHSLFIFIFALLGGCLGTVLYRTRDAKEKPPALTGGS